MFNRDKIQKLTEFIFEHDGIIDKHKLAEAVQVAFGLSKARSVFYCADFAIRFCKAESRSFSNTVLSLSTLLKYDNRPFIVCTVTPSKNFLMLANSTFLVKVSHSSQKLRVDNIVGSFNGSDIMTEFYGWENEPSNFEQLFAAHKAHTLEENLERIFEETAKIQPRKKKFVADNEQLNCIFRAITRAKKFIASDEYALLQRDLNHRVEVVAAQIVKAVERIDNVNLRGRVIEYLITSDDGDDLRGELIHALQTGDTLPQIFTSNDLGDYKRRVGNFLTATDIKSKILFRSSNPKGYNVEKLLHFLMNEDSVYLIYIVAIDRDKKIYTRLCSMFHRQLLSGTRLITQWAGRAGQGVTQFDGNALKEILFDFDNRIDADEAKIFLNMCLKD